MFQSKLQNGSQTSTTKMKVKIIGINVTKDTKKLKTFKVLFKKLDQTPTSLSNVANVFASTLRNKFYDALWLKNK